MHQSYCVVRVQCRRKESSRSLSHLMMSFLLTSHAPSQLSSKQPSYGHRWRETVSTSVA